MRPDAVPSEGQSSDCKSLRKVTGNILHASRRRNDGLARVFHDRGLMEREGSGFDLMYDLLLTGGRAVPTVTEGIDSVHVVVQRRVIRPSVIRPIATAVSF